MENKKPKIWTKEEENLLVEKYPVLGLEKCSLLLSRTKCAIKKRAQKLKIKGPVIKDKYRKTNFSLVVKKSASLTDVIKNLELRCSGGNYKTVNKYIQLYNIDTSHFISDKIKNEKLKEALTKKSIPLHKVLVKNSTYGRNHLKRRLIKEGIIKYECEVCKNKGEWNGKPLTLQLDHINGVHNDNRIKNLRLLCANCHSQTDTYAGKKVRLRPKNTNKSVDAIKQYTKRRKVKRPAYKDLITQVKEVGYRETGRRYGVSDNAIRKWIAFYEKYGE